MLNYLNQIELHYGFFWVLKSFANESEHACEVSFLVKILFFGIKQEMASNLLILSFFSVFYLSILAVPVQSVPTFLVTLSLNII